MTGSKSEQRLVVHQQWPAIGQTARNPRRASSAVKTLLSRSLRVEVVQEQHHAPSRIRRVRFEQVGRPPCDLDTLPGVAA